MKVWQAKEQKQRVAIASGVRTPFAKAGTKLKDCTPTYLGVHAMREAMARVDLDPNEVDECVVGNGGAPADSANIGRIIGLRSGLPQSVPGYTVQRNCASSMEAIAQGCLKIGGGLADTMVIGGVESISNYPLMYGDEMTDFLMELQAAKTTSSKLSKITEFRPNWLKPVVSIIQGLTDPVSGLNMGETAEVLAREFHISREEQDQFALRSHQRAIAGQKDGFFDDEVLPIVTGEKYSTCLEKDYGPRENQSLEALKKLRPFFDRRNGTVTPGNSCPITDGAVSVVMMSEEKAKSRGIEPLGMVSAFAFTGCDPKRMGMGPTYSTAKLLDETGLKLSDIERVELNEAFSAQVIANQIAFNSKKYCQEKLGRAGELGELRDDILNVNGGAVALGHPFGATGARIVLTLLLEMKRKNLSKRLATLCIGGGQGAAFLLERN